MSARVVYIVFLVFFLCFLLPLTPTHRDYDLRLLFSHALTALASFPTLILCIVLGSIARSFALISKPWPFAFDDTTFLVIEEIMLPLLLLHRDL